MSKFFAIIVLFVLVALDVHAAGLPCSKVSSLAADAAFYRDQGLTQEQLRYPLPPRDYFAADPNNAKAAELQLMHEIADELYMEPTLPSDLYVSFKAEQCRLRALSLDAAPGLSSALNSLKVCALHKGKERIACAAKAAAVVSPGNGS